MTLAICHQSGPSSSSSSIVVSTKALETDVEAHQLISQLAQRNASRGSDLAPASWLDLTTVNVDVVSRFHSCGVLHCSHDEFGEATVALNKCALSWSLHVALGTAVQLARLEPPRGHAKCSKLQLMICLPNEKWERAVSVCESWVPGTQWRIAAL